MKYGNVETSSFEAVNDDALMSLPQEDTFGLEPEVGVGLRVPKGSKNQGKCGL